jgi:hypothetical protein
MKDHPGGRDPAANLDYLDPALVDIDAMAADPDIPVLPPAREVLYRLR